MGHDGHDEHGHGHDEHDHHEPAHYNSYRGQYTRPPKRVVPPMGSKEYIDAFPEFDEAKLAEVKPRSSASRFLKAVTGQWSNDEHYALGNKNLITENQPWYKRLLQSTITFPKPLTYTSDYLRPNPCPEQHWWNSWRWPRFKLMNPKIPPPTDGRFSDYYHYLAFKNWFEKERRVYAGSLNILNEMLLRCVIKEGMYNSMKNCRHLAMKYFAMTREEEHNQVLLYMATTGNCAIRETPYPKDYVEQKRKIYDDWLFRTRLKRPGDMM